jgi:D-alanyl-D-alanine dipeptidase
MQQAVKIHFEIEHNIQSHQQKALVCIYVIIPGLSYQLLTATAHND